MTTRRRFLALSGGAALGGSLPWAVLATELAAPAGRITTVSDGQLLLPEALVFGDNPPEEAAALLAAAAIDGPPYPAPCNLTLWQTDDATVLFDAGSGHAFMDSAGLVRESLAALGLAPGDITHLVFTHGHPDHLWGVLDDFEEPAFPNAAHFMGAIEHEYWIDPKTAETIGPERLSFVAGAVRRLEIMGESIALLGAGEEPLPGVVAVPTPGHTPGHLSFRIATGDGTLLVVGDAIGNGHLALSRPGWPSPTDHDAAQGIATRTALLAELAASGEPMVGFHLPAGGLGRVAAEGAGFAFTPL